MWKQGAAYPLVRGLVVEDFGLKLKNFLAHSIKLAYVPGLLVFTELFLERTSNMLHPRPPYDWRQTRSRQEERKDEKEKRKKLSSLAKGCEKLGGFSCGVLPLPRHGDLTKFTYDVERLRSPYLLLFFSHDRFLWSCQVGRRRAGLSMAGWRAKTAIAVILAFLHEATATCPTFVAWLSSSKNRHGNVVRAIPKEVCTNLV